MSTERFELPGWESVSLLRSQHIGRVCVLDHGFPLALPVNFLVIGPDEACQVVMRTGPQTLIGRYEGPASFEVDQVDESARQAWSVIVRGSLRHVTGAHGLPDPGPWLDGRHHWMVLTAAAVTGRRFVGSQGTDGFSVDWQIRTG
ncbi:MAG: pyridoxamine 5'-phosphate oxidase family protein [Actinobacteria bacterium]|nr:pyridoxamine 5'-phosphate oxidase family protein [Actinomycetota bacterium]